MASANTERKATAGDLNDLYETPLESLQLLYENVKFYPLDRILEPCDGMGQISDFLYGKGLNVETNEMFRDKYGTDQMYAEDFLTTDLFNGNTQCKHSFDVVVMNPPFKMSLEFINKALTVAPRVLVFGRASLLEGQKRYKELFSKGNLHNIYMHTKRVGCRKGVMDGDVVTFEPAVNCVCYCWYEFKAEKVDSPKFHWLV